MAFLFESTWKKDFDYFERVFDTETNQSISRKIPNNFEYFVEDPRGQYEYLLDSTIKLSRKYASKFPRSTKEQKVYGITPPDVLNIRDKYWDMTESRYNNSANTWFIDIETTALGGGIDLDNTPEEVVLIQIFDTSKNLMIVFGSKPWNALKKYQQEYTTEVKYQVCQDESEIFKKFFKLISYLKPLKVIGWNTNGFDYPYLYNRATKLGLDTNQFSPFGNASLNKKMLANGMITYSLKADGIHYLDYMELYKKFTFIPRDSFSLDNIAKAELNKEKVNHDMYSTFDGIRTGMSYIFPEEIPTDEYDLQMYNLQVQYRDNPSEELKEQIAELAYDLFVHYGIVDVYLLKELDEKLQLSSIVSSIASDMGCLISDAMGTVKPWASYINNVAFLDKKILPNDDVSESEETMKGGFVADPIVGKHEWIISVDINSAYPNLAMRGFNMSPETYVSPQDMPDDLRAMNLKYFSTEDEESLLKLYETNSEIFEKYSKLLHKYDYAGTITGAVFKRNFQGIIPRLVEYQYAKRKAKKKEMNEWKQQYAIKKDNNEDYSYEKYMEIQCNTSQIVAKTLLNSLFGSCGNKYFRMFNLELAKAITGNTRFYLILLSKRINDYLNSMISIDNSYIIYNDTDSVVGDSVIKTSQGNIKIEDLYNSLGGRVEILGEDNYVKHINKNISSLSFNKESENTEMNRIKYIMKHKVSKRMFKIKHNDDEVIVTEDHSIIIKRGNEFLDVKPSNIIKGDCIIKMVYDMNYIEEFEIEDLGIVENWVYDIEVENNHNFFANNILVHNSAYISLAPFVKQEFGNREVNIQEKVDFCDRFVEEHINKVVEETNIEFSKLFNAYDGSVIVAEREAIASSGIFLAKKKYILRVYDMEGVRYQEPDIKMQGIEIVRSSTPAFSRKYLKESIDIILDKDERELNTWLDNLRQTYINLPLSQISKVSGIGKLSYDLDKPQYDTNGRKISIPINCKSALVTNRFINSTEENRQRYTQINVGDKVKFCYLLEPNPLKANTFAFIDNSLGELFREYVDFDTNWEKGFISPLQIMIAPLGWKLGEDDSMDEW